MTLTTKLITANFIESKEVATGTKAFYFEKPAGFSYKAGQFIDMTLMDPPKTDAEGNTRAFSLITAPSENRLGIATRLRDTAFKRVLGKLAPGSPVQISEPMGSFTLHNDIKKAAVFMIGGIGITPIRSILLDTAERHLPHRLFLFFSNRTPADAPFLDELINLQQKNPQFKLISAMTNYQPGKDYESGRITAAIVKKHLPDNFEAVWYLAGPQAMVKAMRDLLQEMNIDEDYIRTEEFSGY